jgi:hypothetical protein
MDIAAWVRSNRVNATLLRRGWKGPGPGSATVPATRGGAWGVAYPTGLPATSCAQPELDAAVDELDHAIRDIRDIAFDLGPPAR